MTTFRSRPFPLCRPALLVACLMGGTLMLGGCDNTPPPVPVPLPTAITTLPSPCESMGVSGFPRQNPPDPKTYFICKPGVFALNYVPARQTPQWAVQEIKSETLNPEFGPPARMDKDDFRMDPDLPASRSAGLDDFKDTGYSRVFLVSPDTYPFDDVKYSQSQYVSNAVPLYPDRVQAWKGIDQLALTAAKKRGAIKVIAGTIYEQGVGRGWVGSGKGQGSSKANQKGKIEVPGYLFKILVDPKTGEYIAFVVPNTPVEPGVPPLLLTNWTQLEKMTGLLLSPDAPPAFKQQQALPPNPNKWRP